MQILSVDASFGGATHDSFIWANHPIKEHMELISRNEAIWLLGMQFFYELKLKYSINYLLILHLSVSLCT